MAYTQYESALDAAFEYAGRKQVETWQDENSEEVAERLAAAFMLEQWQNDVITDLNYHRRPNGSALVIVAD